MNSLALTRVATRRQLTAVTSSFRAAVPPFLVSRAIVVLALVAAHLLTRGLGLGAAAGHASHSGLLGWDAAWYKQIAAHGYSALPAQALRFFPLLPVLARSLRAVPGLSAGVSVVIVSNAACLVAFAVLYRLVVFELGDEKCARRAVWLLSLAPPAFVLVMGYADSLLLATSLVAFLGIRQRRYWFAVCGGFLAGMCLPVGMLLAVPATVELASNWRSLSRRERASASATVLAAPAGAAVYLGWVQVIFGGFLFPFRQQLDVSRRGIVSDPFVTLARDFADLVRGVHIGVGEHGLWAVLFLVLAVVIFRKLPASYGWYAVALLAAIISGSNWTTLERYGLDCFPFVIVAAMLTRREDVYRLVLCLSGLLLVAFAILAFIGVYVP